LNLQHKNLDRGRWERMTLAEQMANAGSEVERAISWKKRGNLEYSKKAFSRALELLDLTLQSRRGYPGLKETARAREALIDYFTGSNEYKTSDDFWKKYFYYFAYAARRNR